MSSVETGQMSAVETGQMPAAETGQMSAVETRQMSKSQTGLPSNNGAGPKPGQAQLGSLFDPNHTKPSKVNMLKFGDISFILVSNGDVQRSNRICSRDQHAQAQHWLRYAQAQLMHAQHWPSTQSRSRQGGGCPPCLVRIWVRGKC